MPQAGQPVEHGGDAARGQAERAGEPARGRVFVAQQEFQAALVGLVDAEQPGRLAVEVVDGALVLLRRSAEHGQGGTEIT